MAISKATPELDRVGCTSLTIRRLILGTLAERNQLHQHGDQWVGYYEDIRAAHRDAIVPYLRSAGMTDDQVESLITAHEAALSDCPELKPS